MFIDAFDIVKPRRGNSFLAFFLTDNQKQRDFMKGVQQWDFMEL